MPYVPLRGFSSNKSFQIVGFLRSIKNHSHWPSTHPNKTHDEHKVAYLLQTHLSSPPQMDNKMTIARTIQIVAKSRHETHTVRFPYRLLNTNAYLTKVG